RGRAYFDLTSMQWMMYDGLGVLPAEIVKTIGGHQPEIPVPADPFDGPDGRRRKQSGLRLLRALWGLPRRMRAAGDRYLDDMRRHAALDFDAMSDAEIREWLSRLERDSMTMAPIIGLANTYPGPWQMLAESLLRPVAAADTTAILSRLLAGGGNVTSAEQSYRLHTLAEVARSDAAAMHWLAQDAPATTWTTLPDASPFRRELSRFLDEFGHRAVYEADILNPRWADDPGFIVDQIRAHLRGPVRESPRDAAARTRQDGDAAVRRRTLWRRPLIRWAVARLQQALALREYSKSVLASIVLPMRRCYLAVGRRLTARGLLTRPEGIFHLSKIDLMTLLSREWDGRGAGALSEDRAARRDAWLAEPTPPDVIVEGGSVPHAAMAVPAAIESADGWSGIGVSGGRAAGRARPIHHPHDGDRLAHGDVLVAPSTDPGWTPLFLRAAAIVMESGGYLSHGAIVAREFGLPAVVNIPGIVDQLSDEDVILVDGDAARVRRVDATAADA
ncbi:MAG: PEP-utilizing enzyme, partial [Vicinamibacterales bacterium]